MEEFRNINNLSKYQISNFGRVKSLWGMTEKFLKPNTVLALSFGIEGFGIVEKLD